MELTSITTKSIEKDIIIAERMTKIDTLRKEAEEREAMIRKGKNKINLQRSEIKEYMNQIEALVHELENMNNLNETIIKENRKIREDITNKEHSIDRCAEVLHSARNQMRII